MGHVDGPCRAQGNVQGPGEEVCRWDIPTGSWAGIPRGVLNAVFRISSAWHTAAPILAANDTERWASPAAFCTGGKLSTHAHTLLCPTGVINHRLRRALGSEQCHLGEGWHRSSQIVPLFLSTESSIEMFCSSELLEFLFWKSRPPQMCPPPWVIV